MADIDLAAGRGRRVLQHLAQSGRTVPELQAKRRRQYLANLGTHVPLGSVSRTHHRRDGPVQSPKEHREG